MFRKGDSCRTLKTPHADRCSCRWLRRHFLSSVFFNHNWPSKVGMRACLSGCVHPRPPPAQPKGLGNPRPPPPGHSAATVRSCLWHVQPAFLTMWNFSQAQTRLCLVRSTHHTCGHSGPRGRGRAGPRSGNGALQPLCHQRRIRNFTETHSCPRQHVCLSLRCSVCFHTTVTTASQMVLTLD